MPGESDRAPNPTSRIDRRKFLGRTLKAIGLAVGGLISPGVLAGINRALDTRSVEPNLSHDVTPRGDSGPEGKEFAPLLEVPVVPSGPADNGENRHTSGGPLLRPLNPEDEANGGKINPVDGKVYVEK